MTTIDLLAEPRDDVYRALLAFMRNRAGSFSLVWRAEGQYTEQAEGIRDRLAPYLLRTEWTSEWPGTELLDSRATVRHYATVPEAMQLLGEASGLYAWQDPERPEDLAFHRPDGQLLLGSVAHESDAWVEPATVSYEELCAAIPELSVRCDTSEGSPPDV